MQIKLYNSLTDQLEIFTPIEKNIVKMYVCGPTVYNYIHIGNVRPTITFDILKRLFLAVGYQVNHISNITDIDDKIIAEAFKKNISEKELSDKFTKAYLDDLNKLNILPFTETFLVSEQIKYIIEFIEQLIATGNAYQINGNVYFKIDSINEYGCLSNLNIEENKAGARVEKNSEKENLYDFVLWKKTDVGVNWASPWSNGRPGWHTECVAIINLYFKNEKIDIHGGGFDLKFPHHENEIAQSVAHNHHKIANYWMHNGFLNINDEKMSKSLNNFRYANELIDLYGANTIKLIFLSSHYRTPINFSDDIAQNAQNEINKIADILKKAEVLLQINNFTKDVNKSEEFCEVFLNHLANDLNTSNALSSLYACIKELNIILRKNSNENSNLEDIAKFLTTINYMLNILGLVFNKVTLSNENKELYQNWLTAKDNKNFILADELRQKLTLLNIL